MDQDEHESWNAENYPGTLQLCIDCDEPTGRCEEDGIYIDDEDGYGPLCEECYIVHKKIDERSIMKFHKLKPSSAYHRPAPAPI
ncbi:MAG: hypothetical protein WCR46_01275 [Deltaproteobacteria bacterium]